MEHSVDVSVLNNHNVNTPAIGFNHIQNLNKNVCMRKVSPVASRNTHVHDTTIVSNFSDSNRFQWYVDFIDQTLVTVASSSHDCYVYDDVINVSNFKVIVPRS